MKKLLILFAIVLTSGMAKSQTVTVDWQDNNGPYTGYYEISLLVADNILGGNPILVGYKKNVPYSPSYILFASTEINLDPVGIINDQNDRYRYIAIVKRQTGTNYNGTGYTVLLDSGEVTTGEHTIIVNF